MTFLRIHVKSGNALGISRTRDITSVPEIVGSYFSRPPGLPGFTEKPSGLS